MRLGDSRHDIAAARAAGCTVYCVSYGYHEGEAVSATDCDALVESPESALRKAQDFSKAG
ncbi:MAG: HAD hydrolase-like protein [Candidatus Dechloromonas phosphoritropha]